MKEFNLEEALAGYPVIMYWMKPTSRTLISSSILGTMLRGIDFVVSDYRELDIPRNSLIYCDPPYRETTKYAHDFDHDIFWNWCREKREKGHKIFVSEYTCPEDFECVWEGKLVSSLTKDTGNKIGVERLFTIP